MCVATVCVFVRRRVCVCVCVRRRVCVCDGVRVCATVCTTHTACLLWVEKLTHTWLTLQTFSSTFRRHWHTFRDPPSSSPPSSLQPSPLLSTAFNISLAALSLSRRFHHLSLPPLPSPIINLVHICIKMTFQMDCLCIFICTRSKAKLKESPTAAKKCFVGC